MQLPFFPFNDEESHSFIFHKKRIPRCRVTNCNPNPKEMSYKPNESNTINL